MYIKVKELDCRGSDNNYPAPHTEEGECTLLCGGGKEWKSERGIESL